MSIVIGADVEIPCAIVFCDCMRAAMRPSRSACIDEVDCPVNVNDAVAFPTTAAVVDVKCKYFGMFLETLCVLEKNSPSPSSKVVAAVSKASRSGASRHHILLPFRILLPLLGYCVMQCGVGMSSLS